MDSYDSDSSGFEEDENGEYKETNVLLGFASEEPLDDTISHLGGRPTWLDEATPPPGQFAKCKVCNDPMLLLLQLNGDLPEHFPNDERWLYIFGCPRRSCSRKQGSIRAIRNVKKHKATKSQKAEETEASSRDTQGEPQKPKQDLGAAIFGVAPSNSGQSMNSNPFSTSSTTTSNQANPFAPLPPTSTLAAVPPQKPEPLPSESLSESFADKVRVSSPPSSSEYPTTKSNEPAGPPLPWPDYSAFPTPYSQYYLDAEYETISRPPTPTEATSSRTGTMIDEGDAAGGTAADSKDAFESSMDKDFLRFSTRLGHNPEQVLRYEFRGSPLLYSTMDTVGKLFPSSSTSGTSHIKTVGAGGGSRIPRCESCGRERVFEVQLVPHTITVLEEEREGIGLGPKDDSGMEWGTIILGVCAGNCGPGQEGQAGWKEEWIGVQWEERAVQK